MMWGFTIYLEPVGQMRTRDRTHHKHPTQIAREKDLKLLLSLEWKREPLVGAVEVHIDAYFKRPPSHFLKGKKTKHLLTKRAPVYHAQTPDEDNVGKHFKDCGNKILYNDDCQIVYGPVRKLWTTDQPRMEVRIYALEPHKENL